MSKIKTDNVFLSIPYPLFVFLKNSRNEIIPIRPILNGGFINIYNSLILNLNIL